LLKTPPPKKCERGKENAMNFFVAAYIIIWLLLMGYTFYLGQRQNKLRKSIEFLQNLFDKEK